MNEKIQNKNQVKFWKANVFLNKSIKLKHKYESLILAQDERWRRA